MNARRVLAAMEREDGPIPNAWAGFAEVCRAELERREQMRRFLRRVLTDHEWMVLRLLADLGEMTGAAEPPDPKPFIACFESLGIDIAEVLRVLVGLNLLEIWWVQSGCEWPPLVPAVQVRGDIALLLGGLKSSATSSSVRPARDCRG